MIGETTVLLTGKRGNGKTLKAVGMMQKEIAEGRPTFASNFNGLNVPGVQILEDPREWETLPAGSILFVDEAQKFWRSRRSGDPPAEVQAMETQRHSGVTIVLLTQQPTYLDKHIRGLVDLHHHLVLEVGGKASRCYTWTKRCNDEADQPNSWDTADFSMFVFPKDDFGKYQSAEVHTIKPKVPKRLKMIAGAVVVVGGLIFYAVSSVANIGAEERAEGVPAAGATPTSGLDRSGPRDSGAVQFTSADHYRAAFTPLIPEAPWSAPAWAGRPVQSDPHVYCISSGIDGSEDCKCYTEQATRYSMDIDRCMVVARHGEVYNPFKAPASERASASRDVPTAEEG